MKIYKIPLIMLLTIILSLVSIKYYQEEIIVPNQYNQYEVIYATESIEEARLLATQYGIDLIEFEGRLATYQLSDPSQLETLIESGFSYNSFSSTIGKPVVILSDPYLNNQYGITLTHIDDVWKIQEGSADVIVAIIDTGIDYDHEEFANRISSLSYNVTTNSVGLEAVNDDDGHGTMVAGVIGAIKGNNKGIAGITNNTQLLVIKANEDGLDTFKESNIIEGIYYAVDHGADIINLSLGSTYANPLTEEAIQYATDHGVFVIGSAGNDGFTDALYPASFDQVISVGAVDSGSLIASYSNHNQYVDIAAPGTAIYTTALNNTYASASGTSFASPHVSGIIALYLSSYPDASIDEVKTILYSKAKDLGDEGLDDYYGNGLIDALSLFSSTYHQVSFVMPEGYDMDSVFVEDGMILSLEGIPVIPYYEFKGWFTDENYLNPYNFETVVTSDMIIYAKYELKEITITFVIDGETVLTNQYLPNETIALPSLTLDHRTFSGWYTDASFTHEATISLATVSRTYYGYYIPVLYTFYFYGSDSLTVIKTLTLTYNQAITYPEPEDKPSTDVFHYVFKEWNTPVLYEDTECHIYPVYDRIFRTENVQLNPNVDTLYENDRYDDTGVETTTDNIRIEAVNQISTVNTGTYSLYYAVYYEEEIIYYLVRYVTVLDRPVNIIITVRKGISTLTEGDSYEEKGGFSNYGTVEILGDVDTNTPGVYIITYQVSYSNQIVKAYRYVFVLEETDSTEVAVLYYHKEDDDDEA